MRYRDRKTGGSKFKVLTAGWNTSLQSQSSEAGKPGLRGGSELPLVCLAQMVKNLPTMQETQIQSLGQEDLLEEEMATHLSVLAWEIPWTEELGRLQSVWSQRGGHD